MKCTYPDCKCNKKERCKPEASDCIEEVGIVGINYKGISISIKTKKDNTAITFEVGPEIKDYLTNPMMIEDSRTVGQANRQALHARLDALLDANLE